MKDDDRDDRESCVGADSPVVFGATPCPEGEQVSEHAGTAGEASSEALAKTSADCANHTATTGGSTRTPRRPHRISVTRATTKLTIDIGPKQIPDDETRKALYQELYRARWECACAANAITRTLWQIDGAQLDAWYTQHPGQRPTAKDWPAPKLNAYQIVKSPTLASGVVATISRMAYRKWCKERYKALVALKQSPPHAKETDAIPIREQSFKIRDLGNDDYEISFSLAPGRHKGGAQFRIPVRAYDAHMREKLKNIADKTWKVGALTIKQDRIRKSRWYIAISYTREVQLLLSGISCGINRGIVTFLAAVTATGKSWWYNAPDIEAFLRQVQKRRRQYQRAIKASARTGRGRKRALKPIKILEDKGQRWRATKNQTIARQFVAWAAKEGVTTLFMEDLTGIRDGDPEDLEGGDAIRRRIQEWPYYDLGSRITACAEEAGIAVITVPAAYVTQTCAACGYTSKDNVDLKRRRQVCTKCKHSEHMDRAAARNVLARGEVIVEANGGDPAALHGMKPKKKKTARKSARKPAKRKGSSKSGRKRK